MSDPRQSELERREAARANTGEVLDDEAREVPGRSIRQMLSVRLEPVLIRRLRLLASERGVRVSDLVRTAIIDLLARAEAPHVRLTLVAGSLSTPVLPPVDWNATTYTYGSSGGRGSGAHAARRAADR